jgi:hypothetical protein
MDIQASDPGACEGFSLHIHPAQPWGAPWLLYDMCQVSFVRLKWPGRNNPLTHRYLALTLKVVPPFGTTSLSGPGPRPYRGFTITRHTW